MENYYFKFGEMSKIGEKPVQIASGIQISVEGQIVKVKGSKGHMEVVLPLEITAEKKDQVLSVKRLDESKTTRAKHGLMRSLIANAVAGVETPWVKRLEIVGTGYTAKIEGANLNLKLGFSHPVIFKKVEGINFQVEGNNKIVISGVDKQLVGQIAYQIKILKKPDPYKGKGIRYEGEIIKLKPGKKAKTTAA